MEICIIIIYYITMCIVLWLKHKYFQWFLLSKHSLFQKCFNKYVNLIDTAFTRVLFYIAVWEFDTTVFIPSSITLRQDLQPKNEFLNICQRCLLNVLYIVLEMFTFFAAWSIRPRTNFVPKTTKIKLKIT